MIETIIGIDPGKLGGIAILWNNGDYDAVKMPDTERDTYDAIMRAKRLSDRPSNVFAYIEDVHAMPKQGVSSTFKFGRGLGLLRGFLIASGIPFERVSPMRWQKYLGCLTKGDKNVTKAKAQELFPDLKITHAIADSLLIAEYGRRVRTLDQKANP